jgi:hypothetical protein
MQHIILEPHQLARRTKPIRAHEAFLLISALSLFMSVNVAAQTPSMQTGAVQQEPPAHWFSKSMTVYVSDFELDAQNVQVDQGSVVSKVRPGILERPQKKEQKDPEAQAKKLVDTMSKSIVSDLQKAGYKSERLAAGDPKPETGAWVHGVFTQADEGNRIRRAVIGFGSGDASMQLYATLTDLARPERPLYETSADDTTGKKPGAVITMNPYVAAAKFVMEKNAPEKAVKKTASEISDQIVQHLKE